MSKTNGTADLMSLLSPERRAEIAAEISGTKFEEMFSTAVDTKLSLGEFVESLQAEELWGAMANVPLTDVLKSTARKARGPRVALDDATIKTVMGWLKKNPGTTVSKIAEGAAVDKTLVRKVLDQAKKEKLVKVGGEKRNTTYAVA